MSTARGRAAGTVGRRAAGTPRGPVEGLRPPGLRVTPGTPATNDLFLAELPGANAAS